jgi:AraC-like DNA-binding protein
MLATSILARPRARAGEDCEIKPASFSDRLQGQHGHIATPICHRDLLRLDGKTISEIAYAAGFSSQSHLTANFRRTTGLTPRKFRQSLN